MAAELATLEFDALRATLNQRLWALNQLFLDEVPFAAHLTDSVSLDPGYYIRHRIETIKRIRMTARTDALALAAMIVEDYESARCWARYACEELDHDRMFYDDLAQHGLTRAVIDAQPPLAATIALGRFLEDEIGRSGSLAAVAYSVFVEWNSERFSRTSVEKARSTYGDDYVRGSSAHLLVDESENHSSEMIALAGRLSRAQGGEQRLLRFVDEVAQLFRDYFAELSNYRGRSTVLAA